MCVLSFDFVLDCRLKFVICGLLNLLDPETDEQSVYETVHIKAH